MGKTEIQISFSTGIKVEITVIHASGQENDQRAQTSKLWRKKALSQISSWTNLQDLLNISVKIPKNDLRGYKSFVALVQNDYQKQDLI